MKTYIYIYFFYIKILIYNTTHETKKSQSPGTENLRCLGIQKKVDLKGLNKLHMKKQSFLKNGGSSTFSVDKI